MTENKPNGSFKTVISSKRKLFDLKLREIFSYRDLIFLLVKRDFVAKYKQTALGPLWAVIQPLLTTVVFSIVFGTLAGLPVSDGSAQVQVPPFLFYMAGTVLWSYFSSVLSVTSGTFINNAPVMTKVYFPRIAMPISTAISYLITFGIQLILFIVTYAVCLINGSAHVAFTPYAFLMPLALIQLMILSTGVGIIISAMTTKYRDLAMLVAFGLQLWQYATPVAYGLQLIPEKYIGIYMLNPVTPPLLAFRYGAFGDGYFDLKYYLIGWAMTIAIGLFGLLLFNRIEKNFADTV